jgi:hypothetical protein
MIVKAKTMWYSDRRRTCERSRYEQFHENGFYGMFSFPVRCFSDRDRISGRKNRGSAVQGQLRLMSSGRREYPESKKTLSKKDREANNILTAADIIAKMRNPGPAPTHPQEWSGMKMFDKYKISDNEAQKIAEYILTTFK